MNWYRKAGIEECPNISSHLSMIEKVRGNRKPKGWQYTSPDDFIKRHGVPFRSAPLTEEEQKVIARFLKRKGCYRAKMCHYNAQSISMALSSMKLVEGYVFPSLIPIYHSWNSLNGKVIDFTLRDDAGNPILGTIPQGWEYFGVTMPDETAQGRWADTGMAGPVIDDFERGFPLLGKEWKGASTRTAMVTREFRKEMWSKERVIGTSKWIIKGRPVPGGDEWDLTVENDCVMEYPKFFHGKYPVPSRVLWDHPEKVPSDVRRYVERLLYLLESRQPEVKEQLDQVKRTVDSIWGDMEDLNGLV